MHGHFLNNYALCTIITILLSWLYTRKFFVCYMFVNRHSIWYYAWFMISIAFPNGMWFTDCIFFSIWFVAWYQGELHSMSTRLQFSISKNLICIHGFVLTIKWSLKSSTLRSPQKMFVRKYYCLHLSTILIQFEYVCPN